MVTITNTEQLNKSVCLATLGTYGLTGKHSHNLWGGGGGTAAPEEGLFGIMVIGSKPVCCTLRTYGQPYPQGYGYLKLASCPNYSP